ncbi:MAG TPA: hypothetical protein VKK06_06265 [Terriglobia bacterium]|nr:hypothetical protein [Terriglobia bacterium]
MRKELLIPLLILLSGSSAAQSRNRVRIVVEGQTATLTVAARVTTTIHLPEAVNSVIVGDSSLFQAEHAPNEPLLVFVRPVTPNAAQTNLVASTVAGRHFVFLLQSIGSASAEAVGGIDLFVDCRPSGGFILEDSFPTVTVADTVKLNSGENDLGAPHSDEFALSDILRRQRERKPGRVYGSGIRVAIGEVLEIGARLIAAFSVTNSTSHSVELVPPQVQLAGQTRSGMFKRARWSTVQQVPVEAYQLTERRLQPGERIDGVIVFERPSIKQSTEGLFLQIADSAAIDQPVLAAIQFRPTELWRKDHE